MSDASRPYRSVLYIPASNARALEKAAGLPCDAIIFDLEDAVAPDAKAKARDLLADAFQTHDYGARAKIVRINGFDSGLAEADVTAALPLEPDGLLLPKAGSAADIARLAGMAPGVPLWAMMETPQAMLNAGEIAAAPGMAGLVMGTNDLAKELGTRFRADRMPLLFGLQACLTAARAAGIAAIDGVYNAFKDEEGLRRECADGRDMGFDGKTLIHPAQLAIANEVFAPSAEEVALATRQIEAFAAAEAAGQGVAVLDGKIVENLHVATARATLAKARAIKALEEA